MKQFMRKKKEAIVKYQKKVKEDLREGRIASSYKALRRLDPLQGDQKAYCLQAHQDLGLSPQESVERIAAVFVAVSREHEPLVIEELPPNVKEEIHRKFQVPKEEEFQFYHKIRKLKETFQRNCGKNSQWNKASQQR